MIKSILVILIITLTSSCFSAPIILYTKSKTPIYFIHSNEPKIVDINVITRAGSAYDGNKYGLAKLTHSLMRAGNSKLNANKLNNQLQAYGAHLDGFTTRSSSVWHLRSLADKKDLNYSITVLNTILSKPEFNTIDIKSYKTRQKSAILQSHNKPGELLSLNIARHLYKSTPLAHSTLGTIKGVNGIYRKNILKFYKQYYVKNNIELAVVGSINKQQALEIADKCLKNIRAGSAAAKIKAAPPIKKSQTIAINFPAKQSHMAIIMPGVTGTNPYLYPLLVSNQSFGGGMSSKLFNEVRDKRGLAYSVFSAWVPREYGGFFIIKLQTKHEKSQQAIKLVQKLLHNYKTTRPTELQIKNSKNKLLGKMLIGASTNSGLLDELTNIVINKYPINYYAKLRNGIKKVTAHDILAAKQAHIKLNNMLIISVQQKNKTAHE